MDFAFSEDQLLLQQTLRQYAKDKLAPNYHRWDRARSFHVRSSKKPLNSASSVCGSRNSLVG